jgi:hypothetical protein
MWISCIYFENGVDKVYVSAAARIKSLVCMIAGEKAMEKTGTERQSG